jgi:hypothetical protein
VKGGTFQRVGGPNILLEIFQFSESGFFFPTAGVGRSLFIVAPPDVLQPNRIIEIPDKRIKTFYYRDYHHIGSLKHELSGKIKIIEISDAYIFADIKLKVDETDIKFNFKERFLNTDILKYNQIER